MSRCEFCEELEELLRWELTNGAGLYLPTGKPFEELVTYAKKEMVKRLVRTFTVPNGCEDEANRIELKYRGDEG